MRLHEALKELRAAGASVTVSGSQVRVVAPRGALDGALVATLRRWRQLLVARHAGLWTGHVLGWCSKCDEPSMVNYRSRTWPTCRITPRCDGRHVPDEADLAEPAAKAAPGPQRLGAMPRKPRREPLIASLHYPPIRPAASSDRGAA